MNKNYLHIKIKYLGFLILGYVLILLIWASLKYIYHISDRYLPSFVDVFTCIADFKPNLLVHIGWTTTRLLVGFILGVVTGIFIGVAIFKSKRLNLLLLPSLQAIRAIPAIATVPFFILWFGFSETGRFLMVIIGISFNIAIAALQILENVPERYRVLFKSYGKKPEGLTVSYILPTVFESILPTILFSLSTAIGLVIVSELLGSQVGLGYLIQNARSTYSMHVIFLATILLGILNTLFDTLIRIIWKRIVFWGK